VTTDDRDLSTLTRTAHEHVVSALDEPELQGAAGVAWCSAHLAAVDEVLYAEAHHRVPEAHDRLRAARAADRVLQHAIGRLDRRLTGDTHLDHVSVEQVVEEVLSALEGHARDEARLLELLDRVLSEDERSALADQLEAATVSAPTRPHPHVPHTPFSPLVDRLEAVVDRVRDALDNRVGATGRPVKAPRPLGRWGSYLTGSPWPERATPDRETRDRETPTREARDH
jgi:hypothetical protein